MLLHDVYNEFKNGKFVVQKLADVCFTIAMDQAHEQMNDNLKGDGGVIGITDNLNVLLRWITAGSRDNMNN